MFKRLLVALAILLSTLTAPAVAGNQHHRVADGGWFPPTEDVIGNTQT